MNRRGGCCLAGYAGNGGYDMSKVERVMLRFRPIAPKPAPANNDNTSGGGSSGSAAPERKSLTALRSSTRGRRKKSTKQSSIRNYDSKRVVGKKRSRKSSSSSSQVENGEKKPFKTLSFIPETPDVLGRNCSSSSSSSSPSSPSSFWLSFNSNDGASLPAGRQVAVGSWVKVERVTDTWTRWNSSACPGVPLGRTDRERVMHLDGDTCPGFVTDGGYGVRWVNAAYKKLVTGEAAAEVVAWVVVAEGVVVPADCVGFTCRARVVTCGGGIDKKNNNKTVPCDVWKMDSGGFAWRLDITAALSLWIGS